jgi:tRNA-modifying protein YgfZ
MHVRLGSNATSGSFCPRRKHLSQSLAMTGYEALRKGAAWIDLSDRGKIRLSGEDRARLLHAMSTNHVQDLGPGEGLYAFFLTAQGRIVADAYIYNRVESHLLDTEPETRDKLREHLEKYIIADDVTLEDETADWVTIGLEGPNFREPAMALGISVPPKKFSIAEWGPGFVTQTACTGPEGIRIFLPSNQRESLIPRLTAAQVPRATAEEARTVRLENGIPRYGEDMTERHLVHETQQLHAVHSNKGCYLGQEIVERVRSRGQVHRLLTHIRIRSTTPPPSGTPLALDEKKAGEITSAVYSPALQQVVALAYVTREAAESKSEMVISGTGPPVTAWIPNLS